MNIYVETSWVWKYNMMMDAVNAVNAVKRVVNMSWFIGQSRFECFLFYIRNIENEFKNAGYSGQQMQQYEPRICSSSELSKIGLFFVVSGYIEDALGCIEDLIESDGWLMELYLLQ